MTSGDRNKKTCYLPFCKLDQKNVAELFLILWRFNGFAFSFDIPTVVTVVYRTN